MSVESEQEIPSVEVPAHELPDSLRAAGLVNWVREPLDEAVRRRHIIRPPSAATMGTPLQAGRRLLVEEVVTSDDTVFQMGDNPDLPKMPEKPTLADFFRLRFDSFDVSHMLQSAHAAMAHGLEEKVVIACLLHDIAIAGLLSSNHGHWGAQLVAP